MAKISVLFEHASGYCLFNIAEFEEVGMLLPQVEQSVSELKKFNQIVKMVAFSPFKNALSALENMNAISEGILPEDLQTFLDMNIKKKKSTTLGVADAKLAGAISETLGLSCQCSGAIPEIIRGIRFHFANLVKGFTTKAGSVAQLGLGHSYSRGKVKFNINRVDNMIIQSIALLDQLDKDINTFSMRIREWYSYHFPELYKIVPENYLYAKIANYIGNRKRLTEEHLTEMEEIVMDGSKAQAILDASRSSMGMDISEIDLMNISMFAKRVASLSDYRTNLVSYLRKKMDAIAPNLSTLLGDQVAARLISKAGSLTNLAKFPASTVQVLGAEKALFRALKVRGNTPKYGLIYHSTFIAKADGKNKGRISRFLANKSTIASRIDCFAENQTNVFGIHLKQQVEDRLKFYQTGEFPKKNEEVMQEASMEASTLDKKKKKKDKKRKSEAFNDVNGNGEVEVAEEAFESPKKKKKKSAVVEEAMEASEDMPVVAEEGSKKKKKKKKHSMPTEGEGDESFGVEGMNNSTVAEVEEEQDIMDTSMADTSVKKKKKKKKHSVPEES